MRGVARAVARTAGWLLLAIIMVLSFVPPQLRPETGTPRDFEHFAIFFITGVAFGLGYGRRRTAIAAALVLFAGAVEIAQHFVPGRHARVSDFIVDALALCVGVAFAAPIAPSAALDKGT